MTTNAATENRPLYSFSEPLDVSIFEHEDTIFSELVASRAFQRLQSVRFLGGIDYLLVRSPNGVRGNTRHTRYQHSLGVTRLALVYASKCGLSFADRRLVCVAALLHDIGHAPLSHSLEPVFKETFGLEHHRATEDIIAGRAPLGRDIYEILRSHQVDVQKVIGLISGKEVGYDAFFAGPINFDTIEGILRTISYAKPGSRLISPEAVTEAALRRSSDHDRIIVDEFWLCKDTVYHYIINSRTGVLADFACQLFMRRHLDKLTRDDYYLTEAQIFRKLRGLRQLLTSRSFEARVMNELHEKIMYKARRFFIDPSSDFFARDDNARYKQTKHEEVLLPGGADFLQSTKLTQDLFDDDRGDRPSEAILRSQT
jgi:HD superfamily phosphohydrolase